MWIKKWIMQQESKESTTQISSNLLTNLSKRIEEHINTDLIKLIKVWRTQIRFHLKNSLVVHKFNEKVVFYRVYIIGQMTFYLFGFGFGIVTIFITFFGLDES